MLNTGSSWLFSNNTQLIISDIFNTNHNIDSIINHTSRAHGDVSNIQYVHTYVRMEISIQAISFQKFGVILKNKPTYRQ